MADDSAKPEKANAAREGTAKAAVVGAARSDEVRDLLAEWGELGLDQLFDAGLWRDVPFLRTVIGAVRVFRDVRDRLFVQKVAAFLANSGKFNDSEKAAFVRENLDTPDRSRKLRDALVLILDRLDDLDKPIVLAKIFTAFVRGKIQFETFRRLAAAVDIAFIEDLRALANSPCQLREVTDAYLSNLIRTGLAELKEEPNHEAYMAGDYVYRPRVSPLGRVFVGCMNEVYEFDRE